MATANFHHGVRVTEINDGVQTLRGAHYPSHTLWSAWLCAALWVAAQRSATASAADSTSGAMALPISTIDATRSGS